MKTEKIASELNAEIMVKTNDENINAGYTSDMLSEVIANAGDSMAWITLQMHMNVVAVAQLKKIPLIVLTGKAQPAPEVLQAAAEKGLNVMRSGFDSFQTSGRLYKLLVSSEPEK